ncbi:unnamed protein product [Allacma fusca]|uniref:Uncharacterized protein n=1 Tax=Allacma fusca TaxID=39272 RepID=A0A8J2KNQ6_9HEXA|nr:unnamed protein product [Allacma fusca]
MTYDIGGQIVRKPLMLLKLILFRIFVQSFARLHDSRNSIMTLKFHRHANNTQMHNESQNPLYYNKIAN